VDDERFDPGLLDEEDPFEVDTPAAPWGLSPVPPDRPL